MNDERKDVTPPFDGQKEDRSGGPDGVRYAGVRSGKADEARSAPPPLPDGVWDRPKPVRKDSNVKSWLFFLAGICLLVALWMPLRAMYQRMRYKPVAGGVRDADTFIALAYGGISSGKKRGVEDVSREQFAAQVSALRERGYHPIGLQDLHDFYHEGRPLPRRAVLLTMEQAKKNSYLETRDILRQNRWRAVMFVRSDSIRARDPGALRWPILRDMALSGMWDIGVQSYGGFERIPAGLDGSTGNFFAVPRWNPEEHRLETPEEFSARIEQDHTRAVEEFQSEIGAPPLAFAFPYGDYGQYDPRAMPTRVMNLESVERHYRLGFSLGPFLLNTRHTDWRALNRLLVNPDWNLEQFLSVVEAGWAAQPWDIENLLQPSRWQSDWGTMRGEKDGLLLRATRAEDGIAPTTGALAWLVASDLFEDFALEMRFRVHAGQFGIRMRARASGEEAVRILLDADGNARANQKVFGSEEFTIAAAQRFGVFPGKEQTLYLYIHDRRLYVQLDGEMLFKEPLNLMDGVRPGLFGLEVWDPEEGRAAATIADISFPRPRQTLLNWPVPADRDLLYVRLRTLLGRTCCLAAISPTWLDTGRSVPLVMPEWNDDALRTFTKMHAIPVLPRFAVRSVEQALQFPPDLPVLEAQKMAVDGLHLDCRLVEPSEMSALLPWARDIHRNLKERNMKLAINLPLPVKRLATFGTIAALFPSAMIVAESEEQADELREAIPGVVVIEDAENLAADMHLALYYQLAARDLAIDELAPQARIEAFRREGHLAFQAGEYSRALENWHQWLENEPDSAEALALIGRVHVQRDELEQGVDFYRRSLDANPGQVSLVVRLAELLDRLEQVDTSRELLNLYARIFPENPDILIAQAQWLDRRERRAEAREMLEVLVREMPMNLAARMALLRMQDEPVERYRTMRGVLNLARAPDSQIPFGHSLLSMEMLTYPESGVFFDYIRRQAKALNAERRRNLYRGFLPLTEKITDDFTAGRLSEGWIAAGGIRPRGSGRYELRAAVDQSETYLRLRRSELMRDGILEVTLDETQGFFWLYARRSSRTMVRLGFDEEGYMHMQSWHEGQMVSHASRPWIRPPGGLKLSMVVRGDGVRGYVNDQEIFDGPVSIDSRVAYGWWGIAPFAFDLGVARARILRMECHPTPANIVLVPPGDAMRQVTGFQRQAHEISALAPAWSFQNPDGTLSDKLPEDADIMRMFAAFHGIRLLPVVDLSYEGDVMPERVLAFIDRHKLGGVILKRRSPPEKKWLEALQTELEKAPANVMVMQTEAPLWNVPRAGKESAGELVVRPEAGNLVPSPDKPVILSELPVGSVLISPLQESWALPVWTAKDKPSATNQVDLVTPRLFLSGKEGELELAPVEP